MKSYKRADRKNRYATIWTLGKRITRSLRTQDKRRAEPLAKEAKRQFIAGQIKKRERAATQPTFFDLAEDYIAHGTSNLSGATREDRVNQLKENGIICAHLGHMRLSKITAEVLLRWWEGVIVAEGRSVKTGHRYLASIAAVWRRARRFKVHGADRDPVAELRGVLREDSRTKGGRAGADPSQHIHPLAAKALLPLLVEIGRDGTDHLVRVQLMLDAGLRSGEVLGLQWGAINWGEDEEDRTRCIWVQKSKSRGKHVEAPKSGRARKVALSRRLRASLWAWFNEQQCPDAEEYVLPGHTLNEWRKSTWKNALQRAGLPYHRPKDLRDTYASLLLTAGVQLGYIQKQLGHSSPLTTATHYAKWVEEDEYREPMRLFPGEVPADLLARIDILDAKTASKPLP